LVISNQEPAGIAALFRLMGVINVSAGVPFPAQESNSFSKQASGAHA
jgi:hypothetical protein